MEKAGMGPKIFFSEIRIFSSTFRTGFTEGPYNVFKVIWGSSRLFCLCNVSFVVLVSIIFSILWTSTEYEKLFIA